MRLVCSIIQPLSRLSQLLRSPLRVSGRRVEILVAEDLSEADKIIASVGKILMRHCVSKKVRMQADSGDRRILVAKRPDASICQRASLSDEDSAGSDWRSGFQIGLK